MPLTKNAIKKQRVDKKRTKTNAEIRYNAKGATKAARVKVETSTISRLYQALDRAVAKKIMKLSKASRIKARILKAAKPKEPPLLLPPRKANKLSPSKRS